MIKIIGHVRDQMKQAKSVEKHLTKTLLELLMTEINLEDTN